MSDKSNSSKGSDNEEPKEAPPRWKVLGKECAVVVMAIVSMYSAWDAYKKMKNASSDVASIVANWETKPIESISYVTGGGACSSGEEALVLPMFPGVSSGGCGCMKGATYDVTGGSPESAESSAFESCLTNQTLWSNYKCRDIGGLDSYDNKLWNTYTICIKRGFKPATETPYPDAETKECPDGFHKCGLTSGTFEDDRAFCADSSVSAACPITWIGEATKADVLSNYNLGSAPSGSGLTTANGLTTQEGMINVAPVVGMQNEWSPLPIVEIEVGFKMSTGALPCYGELDLQDGNRHDEYSSVENNEFGTGFKANSPGSCEVRDTRWGLSDQMDHSVFYNENMKKYSPMCETNGVINGNVDEDYFNSASNACTDFGSDSDSCLGVRGSLPYQNGPTSYDSDPCDSDNICKQAFFQTRCGAQQRMSFDSNPMGVFQKTQIYWSPDCVFDYSAVIKNNGPLQKAIDWQTYLFYLNAGVNGILILFSLYIIYLTVSNWGTEMTDYAVLEEVWKPRAELFGNWIKIPVVVMTIVFASAVSKFFVTLSEDACSDSMTDSSFDQLGNALPAVIQANIIVLVMDFVGLVPIIYNKFCGGGDKEKEGEAVPTEDDIELAAVAQSDTDSVLANADGKVIVYVDGPETIGGEGTIKFPDGGSYEGFIFKDMRHNDGVMTYADGHKYEGKWKNDLRDGYGTLTKGGESVYAGDWFQDNRSN